MNLIEFIRFRKRRHLPMGKFAVLLSVLLITMVTYPFIDDYAWLSTLIAVIGLFTILAALWAVSDSKVAFVLTALLAVPAFGMNVLNSLAETDRYAYFAVPMAFAFYTLVNIKILRSVVTAKEVNWDILCGAISVYLLLGMNWTLIYTFIDMFDANAFSIHSSLAPEESVIGNRDYFFFSFVTLTTLGYGDIVPLTVPARVFAVLEAITGQLYIAVIIGKIISVSPLRNVMPAPMERHNKFHKTDEHTNTPTDAS
ncbi:potassium channel family protein [Ruficoccus sp. ZRK36]|uniref:potassium channel family protein n=1 Tax=Ruficoccus sp. ZRK36 TaxID=2866311 RepID=UPI001C73B229|nr:potassium channel family protein [Ruficoccus sp. ZRK36]QYY36177.1 hypothetical protein K0V07_01630 [Ruficoccus sp. ZRK36]